MNTRPPRPRLARLALGTLLSLASNATAQTVAPPASSPTAQQPSPAPIIPDHVLWPGVAVIVVIAVFVTAALAGPIIRANNQEELSDSESDKTP